MKTSVLAQLEMSLTVVLCSGSDVPTAEAVSLRKGGAKTYHVYNLCSRRTKRKRGVRVFGGSGEDIGGKTRFVKKRKLIPRGCCKCVC